MGGRQANHDNRQADGRDRNAKTAPPEKTGGTQTSKTKRR